MPKYMNRARHNGPRENYPQVRKPPVKFTEDEDAILRTKYATEPTAVLAREMGRHPESLRSRAQKLGLSRPLQRQRVFHGCLAASLSKERLLVLTRPREDVSPAALKLAEFDPLVRRANYTHKIIGPIHEPALSINNAASAE